MTLYQELRESAKNMHKKLLSIPGIPVVDPVHVARRMTLRVAGKNVAFPSDAHRWAFYDYWLHEFPVNGVALMQSVDPQAAGFTPLETELFEAHRVGQTSLFQTEAWPMDEEQCRLRDLLQPEREALVLTEPGLSMSLNRHRKPFVMFLRILEVRGVKITSGFSLAFAHGRGAGLAQGYEQKTKRTPPESLPEQRFVFFYQKFRESGA